jgi:Dolichyl-phosphate-mannose-protein mannosyltransferase
MAEAISTGASSPGKFKRVTSLLSKRDGIVIGWTLSIKIVLFLFGAVTYQVLENKPVPGVHGLLALWNRWDALAYQQLAEFGYHMSGEFKTWFYPLFPWTVRSVAWVTGDYMVSAFIVSGIASAVAALLLRRTVELDFSPRVALRSVWFFLIFPTAYFLHVGYTESLFLSLALGSILAARTQRWWLAGLLGGLSCMTRANGIVLIPTLGVEIIHQYISQKRIRWQWLWVALVPLGFGVYLFNNWLVSGDAFAFVRLKTELFHTAMAWPWDGIRDAIGRINQEPSQAQIVGAQEAIFAGLGLVCTIATWIRLRPVYGMWMTGNWVLVTSATFLSGTPRYTLLMFPIFMLFALLAANRFWNAILTVWSLLFFAFFSSLYAWGHWAF